MPASIFLGLARTLPRRSEAVVCVRLKATSMRRSSGALRSCRSSQLRRLLGLAKSGASSVTETEASMV